MCRQPHALGNFTEIPKRGDSDEEIIHVLLSCWPTNNFSLVDQQIAGKRAYALVRNDLGQPMDRIPESVKPELWRHSASVLVASRPRTDPRDTSHCPLSR